MGYRSEVAIAIHPDKVSDFLAVLSGCTQAYDLCKGYPDDEYDGMKSDVFTKGDLFVSLSSIKWYEGYKEIDVIDEFIRKVIEDDDEPDKVRFLRIGEDHQDIQECGEYAWDDLRIQPASIYCESSLQVSMKHTFKVGDLVELKEHCKDRNRLAVVVKTAGYHSVFIAFADTGEQVLALPSNLVTINESR